MRFNRKEKIVTDKKQHQAAQKASYGEMPLKDGEERMLVMPGYDYRENPKMSTYGQHGAKLVFAKRRGAYTASVEFFTGWYVNPEETERSSGFMCPGIYSHYPTRKEGGEYAYHQKRCDFTDKGECYGVLGSALYGDTLLDKLVTQGSAAIWKELDEELDRMEKGEGAQ